MSLALGCILCGCTDNVKIFRQTPLKELQAFIQRWCVFTAFHYQVIMQLKSDTSQQVLVCPCCVNWKRRCFNGRKYRIAFTPIDSIIMALTEPGKFKAPDNRCLLRLLKTTSASTNLFTHVLPMHVMHILSGIDLDFTEKVEDKLVLEWWKHNERTEFFNSSATAQAVRLCNKRTIVCEIDFE